MENRNELAPESLSASAESSGAMPIGAWIRLDAAGRAIVGFTYVDRNAGFSARGWAVRGGKLDLTARLIVRLPFAGAPWRIMAPEEVRSLGMETPPDWLASYDEQPAQGTIWGWWREHPKLRGRFHAGFPDTLQVIVHDGGPRLSDRRPEQMWVRVTGGEADVFTGRLANKPVQLLSMVEGSELRFVVPEGGPHPVRVTDEYLRERPGWEIGPCNRCGLTELYDPPSRLIAATFPDLPDGAVPRCSPHGAPRGGFLRRSFGPGSRSPGPLS